MQFLNLTKSIEDIELIILNFKFSLSSNNFFVITKSPLPIVPKHKSLEGLSGLIGSNKYGRSIVLYNIEFLSFNEFWKLISICLDKKTYVKNFRLKNFRTHSEKKTWTFFGLRYLLIPLKDLNATKFSKNP